MHRPRTTCVTFFQYILGKYFSAPTGEEQIKWLLGSKAPDSSQLVDVQRIGLHDFNASVKLFRKGTYLDMYDEFANRLLLTNTDPKFSPIMAHFFLFCFDASGNCEAQFEEYFGFFWPPISTQCTVSLWSIKQLLVS